MERLTLEETDRAMRAARAKVAELGIKVAIAIVDDHGDLLAFVRTDGAPWRTAHIAQGKAAASAAWDASSADLRERWDQPVMRTLVMAEGGRMVPSQGALPIHRAGVLVGAIGASGARPEQDEAVCAAAIVALA